MIYEIRMTVFFSVKRKELDDYKNFKVTLIDYLEADGVAEAFNKAAEYKHRIAIDIAKGESELFAKRAWGSTSDRIAISLDAVVAKPELRLSSKKPLGVNEVNIDWVAKEFGISYATQLLMKKQDYKIVKLVPELNTLDLEDEDEEPYAGWEADTKQIMTIAKSLKKTTDRQKALKKLAKMKMLMLKLEKKYY